MNKKNILIFVLGVVLGIILVRIVNVWSLSNIIDRLLDLNILGNTIDFFGNILIAITSALIAWWVSKSEIRKVETSEKKRICSEKKTYLNLLKLEVGTHLVVMENLVATSGDGEEDFTEDFESLDSVVWVTYIDKMHLEDKDLEKMYKYYLSLSKIIKLPVDEIKENDYSIIRDAISNAQGAISLIDKEMQKG